MLNIRMFKWSLLFWKILSLCNLRHTIYFNGPFTFEYLWSISNVMRMLTFSNPDSSEYFPSLFNNLYTVSFDDLNSCGIKFNGHITTLKILKPVWGSVVMYYLISSNFLNIPSSFKSLISSLKQYLKMSRTSILAYLKQNLRLNRIHNDIY